MKMNLHGKPSGIVRASASAYVLVLILLFVGLALIFFFHPAGVQALPEYSAQTGEPCATCHLSPSGGGPRGPRGQAWVGAGKPGAAPSLAESLELLGIEMEVNPQDFLADGQEIDRTEPTLPLPNQPDNTAAAGKFHNWLRQFDGN